MKNIFSLSMLLALLFSAAGSAVAQQFEQKPLQEALNADGTLRAGASGSFSTQGYQMQTDKSGRPRFVPNGSTSLMSTPGTWDTQFTFPNGTNGDVNAIVTDGVGNLYVGGSFSTVGGLSTPVRNIARFNTSTNAWSALTGAGGGNGVNNTVNALAVSGTDVFVGGFFTQANAGGTVVNVNNIARFNTSTNTWSALGSGGGNGVSDRVAALAVSGSEVYVGGSFTTANVGGMTVSVNNIARFNTSTNTWSALGTGGGNGVNIRVNALSVSGNDVYVGGFFNQANVGGTLVNANNIARFNTSTNTWSALVGAGGGNGVDNTVSAIAVSGNNVFIGGLFTRANVGGTLVNLTGIARFNTNVWSPLGTGSSNTNSDVRSLVVLVNDLFIGGAFTQISGSGMSLPANRIVRFNTDSNMLSALTSGGKGVSAISGSTNVRALAVWGSDVFVGGNFNSTNVGGMIVAMNNIARFNTSTNTWSALTGAGGGNGVNNTVNALAVSGTDVFVGGLFTTANVGGTTVNANRVARFNTSTNTWSALGSGGGNGVNSTVYALAVSGNDLFIGGDFTKANVGVSVVNVNNIARFNTSTDTWSALGSGNGVSGGAGVPFVGTLAVMDNEVFVGGKFTTANVGGIETVVNNIARFNMSTNTWSALVGAGSGNGVNDRVAALAVSGSEVYVGGSFTTANVGGTVVAANRVARFNTSTNSWSALGTGGGNGVNSVVQALAVSGTEVYAGGDFAQANVGGTTVAVNNIARFNNITNVWSTLGSGGGEGVNNFVNTLLVSGSDVFAGGFFDQANFGTGIGIVSSNIGRYFGAPAITPDATNTQSVSSNTVFSFPPTGISISFTGVSGSGSCTVERYNAPAISVSFSGATPINQSRYRFVITASGFTFTNAELRINRTQIPNAGIGNAATVRVYRRPTPGTGAFSELTNAFSGSAPDEVRANTSAFSEFILGSDAIDNPLPVELSAFTGSATQNGARLTWTTQSERNNAGFVVLRSSSSRTESATPFVEVANYQFDQTLRGKGTTASATTYSFLDGGVETGKSYTYKLRSFDLDGTVHDYAQTVSVEVREPVQARVYEYALMQNYPNPFNPTTVIPFSMKASGAATITVYDMLGRTVSQQVVQARVGENLYQFNGSTFGSGVYFYTLQAGGVTRTMKMMLVK